jgi:hypothetical protein
MFSLRRYFPFIVMVCAGRAAASLGPAIPVPAPEPDFGFKPGAGFHLADYELISKDFQDLAAASPRVKLQDIGPTGYGKRMFIAISSSEENLRNLERYKGIVFNSLEVPVGN